MKNNALKTIVIEPGIEEIQEREFEHFDHKVISELVVAGNEGTFCGHSMYDPFLIQDILYVDDEGAYKSLKRFYVLGYPMPLFGRGIIVGPDSYPEEKPTNTNITLDIAIEMFYFEDPLKDRVFADYINIRSLAHNPLITKINLNEEEKIKKVKQMFPNWQELEQDHELRMNALRS